MRRILYIKLVEKCVTYQEKPKVQKNIAEIYNSVFHARFGNIQSVNFDCELAWAQPIFYDT